MNREKGFTLMELLGVIILLAVIAVITTPIVLHFIEEGRFSTFKSSIAGVERSLKYDHAIADYEAVFYEFPLSEDVEIDVKGNLNNWEGQSLINENGQIALSIKSGNYCAYKLFADDTVTYEKNCESLENSTPIYVLQSWEETDTTDFHNSTYKENILTAEFVTSNSVPGDAIESWDVSEKQDGSILAWVLEDEIDATKYHLYIGGKGGVRANSNSAYLFANFTKLTLVKGLRRFDTSNTKSMDSMFENCSNLTELSFSISNIETSVKDIFKGTTKLHKITLNTVVDVLLDDNHSSCAPSSGRYEGWYDNELGTGTRVTSISSGSMKTYYAVFSTDVIPPVITVDGHTSDYTITQGPKETFTVPTATAVDNVDGVVAVTTTGNVTPKLLGTYTITYQASDSLGNKSTLVLTVVVVDPTYSEWMTETELVLKGHSKTEFGAQSKTQYGYQDASTYSTTFSTTVPSSGYYKTGTEKQNVSFNAGAQDVGYANNTAMGTKTAPEAFIPTGTNGSTWSHTGNINFTLQGSADNSTWYSLGGTSVSAGAGFSVSFADNIRELKYFKIVFNSASNNSYKAQWGSWVITGYKSISGYYEVTGWGEETGWRDGGAYTKTTTRKPVTRTLYRYQTN